MNKYIKRFTSFLIVFLMLFGMMPWQDMNISFAAQKVTSIELLKRYIGEYNTASVYYVTVYGTELDGLEVLMQNNGGEWGKLTPKITSSSLIQYEIPVDKAGGRFNVGGQIYSITEDDVPQIFGVSSVLVKSGEQLGVTANKLTHIDTDNSDNETIKIRYYNVGTSEDISSDMKSGITDDSKHEQNITINSKVGTYSLESVKQYKDKTYDSVNGMPIKIQYIYENAFTVYDEMNLNNEDIIINPNKSKVGDTVTISTQTFPDANYSVFLVPKDNSHLLGENLGIDIKNFRDMDPKVDDTITFKVPNLSIGTYNVILTNPVKTSGTNSKTDFTNQILKKKNIGLFTITDGKMSPIIQSVSPSSGPDTGSEVGIYGKLFEELNIDGLANFNSDIQISLGDLSIEKDRDRSGLSELKLDYSNFLKTAPSDYTQFNNKKVTKLERYISVIIGSDSEFKDTTKQIFKKQKDSAGTGFDYLNVTTKGLNKDDKDLVKDVQVNIETVITTDEKITITNPDGSTKQVDKQHKISEQAKKENTYTYTVSFIEPTINTVEPDSILVKDYSGEYKTEQNVIISIKGKDFNVFKFINKDGNEIITYPKVVIGLDDENDDTKNEIALKRVGDTTYYYNKDKVVAVGEEEKRWELLKDAKVEVLNSQGREVDGTTGNENGNKILVRIPSGIKISDGRVNVSKQNIGIGNPVKKSMNFGPIKIMRDVVKFVATDNVPNITDIKPNIVTIDGGEKVIIKGTNFASDVQVFIDGEEVKGIKRNGTGEEITFNAPKGREGDTLVYVINPSNGGLATYPFKYVKTYTEPKITNFSPKKGKTGTLVVVDGKNFVKPDPTALERDIFKLVGTRVLLEGDDINEYNEDPKTKEIKLQAYTSKDIDKIIRINNEKLEIADYYHSIILKNKDTDRFYTIDAETDGDIVIHNGIDERYTVKYEAGKIKAHKQGGGVYEIEVKENSIKIKNPNDSSDFIDLNMMTVFKVVDKEIVGDKVHVVGIDKLYFEVPTLPADGYYDVTIENPDTKKDSRVNEQGFYYYTQPSSKPSIQSISPDKGSVDGGYKILIKGKKEEGKANFVDDGKEKTEVYINGTHVPNDQVVVSTDGESMEVVVPKLDIDLMDKYGTNKLTVPVVVVNPDGGSASKENGFTYIVPSSHPNITKVSPEKGNAFDGKIVEITGKDFRLFEPYIDKNRNQNWDKDEEYTDLNGYSIKSDGSYEKEIGDGTQGPDDFRKGFFVNKTIDELKEFYKDKYKDIVYPVLPKVYFGAKEAEIIEFSAHGNYIKVKPPKAEKAGSVDVYIVNNDSGISNKLKYTYESYALNIESIIPNKGKKQGKDKIEIMGSGFTQSNIKVYEKKDDNSITLNENVNQVLVRFGEITNKNIDRYKENSGLINSSRTTVNLEGNLSIEYKGIEHKVIISAKEGDKTYTQTFDYNDDLVYVPLNLLVDSENGAPYSGYELIQLKVLDRRLLIERGYSPKTKLINDGQIEVNTSSYHTIGKVPLTIINPDGGEAKGEFEYTNPTTDPKITNILKEGKSPDIIENIDGEDAKVIKVNYKGGNTINIIGEDFAEDGTVYIGNKEIPYSELDEVSPNKLTFKMPDKGWEIDKHYIVTISNVDGGSANSKDINPKPIYIIFTKGETPDLSIESVIPNSGPSEGGTRVEITGKDFRKTMEGYDQKIKIYFGDKDNIVLVPESNIISIAPNKIILTTPPHKAGTVNIKIVNPDENITELEKAFTYISRPKIVGVFDLNDKKIDTISVDGGEKVKLKGSDFIKGARVIFNPVLEEFKENSDQQQGEVITIEDKKYTLKSGGEALEVEVIDSQNITLKTPSGKIKTYGVMVINPDASGSNVYEKIIYDISKVEAPGNVEASLIYDKYINITWDKVEGATSYEVYVVTNNSQTYFIGNTNLTSFIYKDLESNTKYKFIVKAIGKYGLSNPSMVSNEVETGRHVGPEDKDGELSENTSSTKVGDTANIIIGTDDYDDKEIKIDLTKGPLAGSKEVVVSMPAKVVSSYLAKDITVIGNDFYIKFNPTVFNVSKIEQNRKREDTGVRFKISPNDKKDVKSFSNEYILSANAFVGKDISEIDYLKSKVQLSLDLNVNKANMRRNRDISLRRYDEYSGNWIYVKQRLDNYSTSINTTIDKLGIYSIIGKRR